jgi:hypothetical protein
MTDTTYGSAGERRRYPDLDIITLAPRFNQLTIWNTPIQRLWTGGHDAVHVFAADGERIGQIRLPESCANVCFGRPKRNRLFMTASQSLYAVYVNTRGAHAA